MPIDVRACADEEQLIRSLRTVEGAFGGEPEDSDIERAKKTMPVDRALIAWDGEAIAGTAASFPFSLTIPGGELPCAGVTWVGVLPTHRRRGVLRELMRFQLDDSRRRREPIAALWASESVIYGRFGYGIAAPVHEMKAFKTNFAFRDDPEPAGSVRVVTREEAGELYPPVYERVRARRGGMIARDETWGRGGRPGAGPGAGARGPGRAAQALGSMSCTNATARSRAMPSIACDRSGKTLSRREPCT